MAKIFITGSADGLGQMAATSLINEGHEVVLHARNEKRANEARAIVPGAKAVLIGDLSSIDETIDLARQANEIGPFDAIIHNAGVYQVTTDVLINVNILAPYVLTSLIKMPSRLIYLSSGMHLSGSANLESLAKKGRVSYSDSKLHMLMLARAIARRHPNIYSNTVDPGWVPTKMGGSGAPDDLDKGYETQAWLAVSNDAKALVTGKHFHHKGEARHNPAADDVALQDKFLAICEQMTSVKFNN